MIIELPDYDKWNKKLTEHFGKDFRVISFEDNSVYELDGSMKLSYVCGDGGGDVTGRDIHELNKNLLEMKWGYKYVAL